MNRFLPCLSLCGTAVIYSSPGLAYMGPSFGLGVIGTLIAVVVVSLLSLFAFIVLPIRRMLKKSKQKPDPENTDMPDQGQ